MNYWWCSIYWFLMTLFWLDMFFIQVLLCKRWKNIAKAWESTSDKWKELYYETNS